MSVRKRLVRDRLSRCALIAEAKEVESGANLVLLTPFDQSVFVRRCRRPSKPRRPLQTYLDLQSMAGRGSEAAEAVFEKHLRRTFDRSQKRVA